MLRRIAAVLAVLAPLGAAAQFDDGPTIPQADLVADFDGWMAGLRALNPDLSIRADLPTFEQEAARIRAELTHPMSRREAWLHFAQLNPYFRDGHAGVQQPNYRAALEAHLKAGGHIVPIEVRFDRSGALRVFTVAAGVKEIEPGDRLLSINRIGADQMVSAMLPLSIDDTPAGQRAWMERRFAMLFRTLYGDTGHYEIAVQTKSGRLHRIKAPGGTVLPLELQDDPKAADLYAWRILPGGIGYLRIDSFAPNMKDALAKVTQTAFTAFKQQKAKALIIDVRENGGGDDPLWEQDLVDHFTTKPYVQLSHYVQRITKDNAEPGDVVGGLRNEDYDKRFTPPADDPIRFEGPVYILAGPYSYSATIQFLVAAQDFGLAKIAGEETAALSCQTGQVKPIGMPKTGLSAVTPIIAYTRPSGTGCKRGVIPDIPVAIDEVRPDETLKRLVSLISVPYQPPPNAR